MKTLTFKSYNSISEVNSCSENLFYDLLNPTNNRTIEKMIPSVSVIDGSCTCVDSRVSIRYREKFNVVETYPNYKMDGNDINYIDVLALTEHLLERGRQEEGIYNLHSSAIGLGDRCVIVHGASKSGKTLVSLNASENYNLRFLSNERALIDLKSSLLVGGCSTLDLSDYHQKSFKRFNGKTELILDKISSPYNIVAVVQPIIDSGVKSPNIISVNPQDAEWSLYPEFTGRIRGDNRRLRGGSKDCLTYPLDSLDTKELSMQRMANLQVFLYQTPVYFVRGDLESICGFINDKLK